MRDTTHGEPIIEAHGVSRAFGSGDGQVFAVKDLSIDIARGEFLAITGRSGSGKTTLLNMLGGLDRPTNGTVYFERESLSAMSERELTDLRRHKVSFVFQSFGLLLILSAYENVELPLRVLGLSRAERGKRVQQVMEAVGLGARVKHRPYELSGGEQQRVAVARALAMEPSVIIADEPTGELDLATGMSIITLLKQVARDQGITVVVATHDLVLAGMADRVKNMVDGVFDDATSAVTLSEGSGSPPS